MEGPEKRGSRESKEEGGNKKKAGRPSKIETLGRERSLSTSSTKTMEDYMKKEREEEKSENDKVQDEIFKRSKLIARFPEKEENSMDTLEKLVAEIKEMRREQREASEENKKKREKTREEIRKMREEIREREEEWKRERVLLKEEIKELKEKIGMMELTKEVDLLNVREVNKVRRLLG